MFLFFLFSAFIISLAVCIFWSYTKNLWAFYLMPSRIWQFSLGGIVLVLSKHRNNLFPTALPLQTIGLALIIFSGIFLNSQLTYPGWWALLPSIGAALALSPSQLSSRLILTNPILVWVGDRSYAWYLWHWPIIILARKLWHWQPDQRIYFIRSNITSHCKHFIQANRKTNLERCAQ